MFLMSPEHILLYNNDLQIYHMLNWLLIMEVLHLTERSCRIGTRMMSSPVNMLAAELAIPLCFVKKVCSPMRQWQNTGWKCQRDVSLPAFNPVRQGWLCMLPKVWIYWLSSKYIALFDFYSMSATYCHVLRWNCKETTINTFFKKKKEPHFLQVRFSQCLTTQIK